MRGQIKAEPVLFVPAEDAATSINAARLPPATRRPVRGGFGQAPEIANSYGTDRKIIMDSLI
jgi:hypothetical protein